MRFIKLAIISAGVLFLIVTALGLLLPSRVRVTRNITIQVPHDTLHRYISDVKYWKLWMEGARENSIVFLSRKTAGKGTIARVGNREVEITLADSNKIEAVWKGENNKHFTSVYEMRWDDTTDEATNLNWYFEQRLAWYPWERLPALANEQILGPSMEHSLDSLKAVAQSSRP